MGRPENGNDGPCKNAFRAVYDVPSLLFRYAMDRFGGGYPEASGRSCGTLLAPQAGGWPRWPM